MDMTIREKVESALSGLGLSYPTRVGMLVDELNGIGADEEIMTKLRSLPPDTTIMGPDQVFEMFDQS